MQNCNKCGQQLALINGGYYCTSCNTLPASSTQAPPVDPVQAGDGRPPAPQQAYTQQFRSPNQSLGVQAAQPNQAPGVQPLNTSQLPPQQMPQPYPPPAGFLQQPANQYSGSHTALNQQPPIHPGSITPPTFTDSDGWQSEAQPPSPNSFKYVLKIIASIIGFIGVLVALILVLIAILT